MGMWKLRKRGGTWRHMNVPMLMIGPGRTCKKMNLGGCELWMWHSSNGNIGRGWQPWLVLIFNEASSDTSTCWSTFREYVLSQETLFISSLHLQYSFMVGLCLIAETCLGRDFFCHDLISSSVCLLQTCIVLHESLSSASQLRRLSWRKVLKAHWRKL
jgi:hypothetical protein